MVLLPNTNGRSASIWLHIILCILNLVGAMTRFTCKFSIRQPARRFREQTRACSDVNMGEQDLAHDQLSSMRKEILVEPSKVSFLNTTKCLTSSSKAEQAASKETKQGPTLQCNSFRRSPDQLTLGRSASPPCTELT